MNLMDPAVLGVRDASRVSRFGARAVADNQVAHKYSANI